MSDYHKTISFAELIKDRHADVRVTSDGFLYAVDLAMVMTCKNRDDAGKAIRNISEETFSSANFIERNTGGSGNFIIICEMKIYRQNFPTEIFIGKFYRQKF
jgi:hypothetical protein